MDDVVPQKKKREWLIEAAKAWAEKLPADLTVGNPNGGGREGVSWKRFEKGEKYEPFLYKSRPGGGDARMQEDELLKTWSENYLSGAGIIAMVKEGVFINESLNHLKQFLLKRAGRIQSLMQLMGKGAYQNIAEGETVVPGTSDPVLPVMNDWDYDRASQPRFLDYL